MFFICIKCQFSYITEKTAWISEGINCVYFLGMVLKLATLLLVAINLIANRGFIFSIFCHLTINRLMPKECSPLLWNPTSLLRETIGECIISHIGSVKLPSRSCNITPMNYILQEYVKLLILKLINHRCSISWISTFVALLLIYGSSWSI